VPLLWIDLLGEIHRALHVGEKHRDLVALALKGAPRRQNLLSEVLGGVRVPGFEAGASGFPHSPQNLMPGAFSKSQPEHLSFSGAPHSPQNFMPLAFSKPQTGQRIDGPLEPPAP
jgi:hypothetical protein